MQERRQDESLGVLDWVDLADGVLGIGNYIVELGVEGAISVAEAAGSVLFSLLDGF